MFKLQATSIALQLEHLAVGLLEARVMAHAQPFTAPGATAHDPQDGDLPVSADCASVDTNRAGRYQCTYRATDSAANTVTASRDVIVGDPDLSCTTATASPAGHLTAGRAVTSGWLNAWSLSNADLQNMGLAWNFWSGVILHQGKQANGLCEFRTGVRAEGSFVGEVLLGTAVKPAAGHSASQCAR